MRYVVSFIYEIQFQNIHTRQALHFPEKRSSRRSFQSFPGRNHQ